MKTRLEILLSQNPLPWSDDYVEGLLDANGQLIDNKTVIDLVYLFDKRGNDE